MKLFSRLYQYLITQTVILPDISLCTVKILFPQIFVKRPLVFPVQYFAAKRINHMHGTWARIRLWWIFFEFQKYFRPCKRRIIILQICTSAKSYMHVELFNSKTGMRSKIEWHEVKGSQTVLVNSDRSCIVVCSTKHVLGLLQKGRFLSLLL